MTDFRRGASPRDGTRSKEAEAREWSLAEEHHQSASDATQKPDVPTLRRHTEVGALAVFSSDPVRDRKPDVTTMQRHIEADATAVFSCDPVQDRKPDVPTMHRHTDVGSPTVFSYDPVHYVQGMTFESCRNCNRPSSPPLTHS